MWPLCSAFARDLNSQTKHRSAALLPYPIKCGYYSYSTFGGVVRGESSMKSINITSTSSWNLTQKTHENRLVLTLCQQRGQIRTWNRRKKFCDRIMRRGGCFNVENGVWGYSWCGETTTKHLITVASAAISPLQYQTTAQQRPTMFIERFWVPRFCVDFIVICSSVHS